MKYFEKMPQDMGGEIRYQRAYWKEYLETAGSIYSRAAESRKHNIPIQPPEWRKKEEETPPPPDPKDPMNNGLNSVAGGGNAIRNITVNITKLIESQNINTKNITESQGDIQRLVEEALIRAIAGTEQMLQ